MQVNNYVNFVRTQCCNIPVSESVEKIGFCFWHLNKSLFLSKKKVRKVCISYIYHEAKHFIVMTKFILR